MATFKCCMVSQCTSSTTRTPEKIFVPVPIDPNRRKKWLNLTNRKRSVGPKSNVYMCEDHFNMHEDIINYMQFKMGFAKKLLVMDTAVPSKFNCQEDHKKRLCDLSDSHLFICEENIKLEKELNTELIIKEEIFEERDITEHELIQEELLEKTVTNTIEPRRKVHLNEHILPYEFVAIKLEQQLNSEEYIKDGILDENVLEHQRTEIRNKCFPCEVCDKTFTRKNYLIRHKLTHTGKKPFSCDFCDKTFVQKVHLNKHKLTHTGEKPFK